MRVSIWIVVTWCSDSQQPLEPATLRGGRFKPGCCAGSLAPRGFAVRKRAGTGMSAPSVVAPMPSQPAQDLNQEAGPREALGPGLASVREKGPSPINLKALKQLLLGYPRRSDALFLLDGF